MSQIIKTMHLKYISKYQGFQTKELYTKMTKIWIADVWWQPFLILRIVGKRCHLQLGIRQKWIQHKKIMWKQQMKYFSSEMPTGLYLGLYFNFLTWLYLQYRTEGSFVIFICSTYRYMFWYDSSRVTFSSVEIVIFDDNTILEGYMVISRTHVWFTLCRVPNDFYVHYIIKVDLWIGSPFGVAYLPIWKLLVFQKGCGHRIIKLHTIYFLTIFSQLLGLLLTEINIA